MIFSYEKKCGADAVRYLHGRVEPIRLHRFRDETMAIFYFR
jgi:hypothetical protein